MVALCWKVGNNVAQRSRAQRSIAQQSGAKHSTGNILEEVNMSTPISDEEILVEKINAAVSDMSIAMFEDDPEGLVAATKEVYNLTSRLLELIDPIKSNQQ